MKKKKKRNTGLKWIAVMVMIICVVVLYRTRNLAQEIDQKKATIEKLNEDYQKEENRTKTLEDKKAFQSTKRYIEEMARTKLGLYYPDEIIIKESD